MIGFRSVLKGLAFAALVPALIAPAGARTLKTIAGWDLNATAKTCTMTTTSSDDVTIGLVWAPSTSELGFMVALPHSQGAGLGKSAPVELSFDGGGSYTQWQADRAAVIDGKDSVGVIANWGAEHSDELASAVAAASHVRVRVGDRDLGSYNLSGSPAAYRALKQCGSEFAAAK